jgi:protein SCO1/2
MGAGMSDQPSRTLPRVLVGAAVLLVLVLVGAGAVWFTQGGAPTIGGPFKLVNGQGKTVTDRDFRGRYLLVYFGYTFCPDVCPTTLNQMADALDALGSKGAEVQPLFITVDPKRDTPQVIGQYVANFSPRLVGLTGTPEEIAKVAREYRVYYAIHKNAEQPADYTVDHSSILYLMSPSGAFIAPIRADQSGADMAKDIARHLS